MAESGTAAPIRVRPPLIALGLTGVAWLTHWVLATAPLVPAGWRKAGWAAVAAGPLLAIWALTCFRRAGTPHDPFAQPAALVVAGPYRWSRNPMYLSVGLTLMGIGILVGSLPFLAVAPSFLFVMARAFVPYEEAKLEARLGEPYRRYRQTVRRWI